MDLKRLTLVCVVSIQWICHWLKLFSDNLSHICRSITLNQYKHTAETSLPGSHSMTKRPTASIPTASHYLARMARPCFVQTAIGHRMQRASVLIHFDMHGLVQQANKDVDVTPFSERCAQCISLNERPGCRTGRDDHMFQRVGVCVCVIEWHRISPVKYNREREIVRSNKCVRDAMRIKEIKKKEKRSNW